VFIIKYVISRIGTETELHGHEEAFGKEKGATMLGIVTEKEERKAQEPMAKREGREEAKT
jgi:hypothetical protein